jgi:ABC-type lipoprotein export system ATPase subunit
MVLATHDPLGAKVADLVYVLEDGRLVSHAPDAAPAFGH